MPKKFTLSEEQAKSRVVAAMQGVPTGMNKHEAKPNLMQMLMNKARLRGKGGTEARA